MASSESTNVGLPSRVVMLGWPGDVDSGGGAGIACKALAESLVRAGVEVLLVSPRFDSMPQHAVALANGPDEVCQWIVPGPYMDFKAVGELARIGTKVEVVGASADKAEDASPPAEGVRTAEAGEQQPASPVRVKLREEPTLASSRTDEFAKRFAAEVRQIVEAEAFEPEVVHAHDWFTFSAAVEVAEAADLPIVFHVHSTEFDRHPGDYDLAVVEREREAVDKATRVIAVSNRTAVQLAEKYEVNPEIIDVIEPDAPPPEVPEETRYFPEFTVLFLGRITDQKGPFFFLEAAERLLAKDRDWRFVVAGNGDRLAAMIEHAARAGIGDRLHFVGHVDAGGRDELFAMADLLLMPSVSEPFGLVATEAVRAGLPAFVSRQSGVADWLPTDMQADYWDLDRTCRRLRTLRDEPEALGIALAASMTRVEALSEGRQQALLRRCYERARRRRES